MTLDPRLLEILCCPAEVDGRPCHGPLQEQAPSLSCQTCGRIYPIREGIPVLLPTEAVLPE